MMKIAKYLKALGVVLVLLVTLQSCKKEYSQEGFGAVTGPNNMAWSLSGNDSLFNGCIDTAFYGSSAQIYTLTIQGSDSLGNTWQAVLTSDTAKFQTGVYSLSSGNVFSFSTAAGNVYSVGQSGTQFIMQVSFVSDTVIEATFSGVFKNSQGDIFNIVNGRLKAFIGMANPCGDTGTGNPPPTGTGSFAFDQGGSHFAGGATGKLTVDTTGPGSKLTIGGMTSASQILTITVGLPGTTVTTGTFISGTPQNAVNSFLLTSAQGTNIIYQSNSGTPGAYMAINITSYDPATEVVKGTFAGMAKHMSNQNVPITNGTFEAVVQ